MHHLGVVSTAKPLVHMESTLGVLAVRPFALPASAVSFLGRPVHCPFNNIATLWTLQQYTSSSMPGSFCLESGQAAVMQRHLLANGGFDTDPLQHALNDRPLCYSPVSVAAHTVVAGFTSSAAGS